MTQKRWIEEKIQQEQLESKDLNMDVIRKLVYLKYPGFCKNFPESTITELSYKQLVCHVAKSMEENNFDNDIVSENVRLAKQLQKQTDLNRIKGKGFREYARIENSIEEYSKALIKELKKYDLSKFTIKHEVNDCKCGGVCNLSDTHFNELVDIMGNRYDFLVAAKRLKLLAIQIKKYFVPMNIKSVLLCLTGDLINSDRRLDELLNQAVNRADATLLSFYLLKQFILDLNKDFNITIASVSGNESRINDEHGFSDAIARDNFDFVLENFIRLSFDDCPGISFIDGGSKEKVVSIAGQNILLLHGESLKGNNTQKTIEQKVGCYALKGVKIDYCIFGHFHSAYVGDYFSRSSSLVGSNSYNEYALNLVGRSSQNIFVFYTSGNRDSIKVDLQNTDNIEGYDIIKELEKYNAKSNIKANSDHRTIMEIII